MEFQCFQSSLLNLVLRELKPLKGQVKVHGTVSFASQEPWIFPGSIRKNILFGAPYDAYRYNKVTRACALFEDFATLPSGDKTLVGDNGANLSGGQRARVNLARYNANSLKKFTVCLLISSFLQICIQRFGCLPFGRSAVSCGQ